MTLAACPVSSGNVFAEMVVTWGKPVFTFETPANEALFQLGAQPLLGGT